MFKFFKNEMKAPEAPKQIQKGEDMAPFQQTKIEDELATFEVPDFSEDDLNFDLGLGEFMPPESLPPEPKGLPIDMPPLPELQEPKTDEIKKEDINTENTTQADTELENISIDAPKIELSTQEQKGPESSPETTKFSWAGEGIEQESPDDDLPKFNISTGISFSELKAISEEVSKPKQNKTQKNKKEEIKEKETIVPEKELFLQKGTYKKIIILSDDTMKKSASAETMKANYVSLSELQDAHVDDLTRTMKSIRDSIMLVDAKLFEKGDT